MTDRAKILLAFLAGLIVASCHQSGPRESSRIQAIAPDTLMDDTTGVYDLDDFTSPAFACAPPKPMPNWQEYDPTPRVQRYTSAGSSVKIAR